MHVATVVITFNRLELLKECIQAIALQSRPSDSIFVLDNASTDGTGEWLHEGLPANLSDINIISQSYNSGGAGGFARGLKEAIDAGAEWVWMMDDDARPHRTALEELLKVSDDPDNVYGSLAINNSELAWAATLEDHDNLVVDKVADVPQRALVESLPFLGFMIHRSLVSRIGLPDAGFFILSDDTEYCLRAKSSGAEIVLAGHSHIDHPKTERHVVRVPFGRVTYLRLPAWKRYYHTRNKLLIARRYFGLKLITQTIPGLLVRFTVSVLREPDRLAQAWAFFAGMADGLLGRKGYRHEKWGITR